MDRGAIFAVLAPAFILYACDRAVMPSEPTGTVSRAAPTATTTPPPSADASPGPSPSGPRLTSDAARGATGARDVLLDFARAIERKQFDAAWTLLGPDAQRQWTKAEFAAAFRDLSEISVAVPIGSLEGAAGSSFYTAPMAIAGEDRTGRPVRIEGEAILRRVNDVPGATAPALTWRFDRLTLDWTH